MPNLTGPNTYKGYKSPDTHGWPKPIREEVKKVYGAYREKHPGEDHAIKARGARIAWSQARKKYPQLYRNHRKLMIEVKKEKKEHRWLKQKEAEQIVADHHHKKKFNDVDIDIARSEAFK